MTNLTEQWKKCELPLGHYYVVCSKNDTVEILQNRVQIASCNKVGITYDFPDYWEVKQVLAEVPSYEEYQQLLSDQLAKNEGVEINAELKEENTKLKELLGEVLRHDLSLKEVSELSRKISQVLQENKR